MIKKRAWYVIAALFFNRKNNNTGKLDR